MTKKIKRKLPKPAVVTVAPRLAAKLNGKKPKNKKKKDILFCKNWKETKSKVENVEIIDWDGFIPEKAKVVKSLETHTQVSFSMDKKEIG